MVIWITCIEIIIQFHALYGLFDSGKHRSGRHQPSVADASGQFASTQFARITTVRYVTGTALNQHHWHHHTENFYSRLITYLRSTASELGNRVHLYRIVTYHASTHHEYAFILFITAMSIAHRQTANHTFHSYCIESVKITLCFVEKIQLQREPLSWNQV